MLDQLTRTKLRSSLLQAAEHVPIVCYGQPSRSPLLTPRQKDPFGSPVPRVELFWSFGGLTISVQTFTDSLYALHVHCRNGTHPKVCVRAC